MRADERERYRLQGGLGVHRRRVMQSATVVREAMAAYPGTWAVAASGGKDSTAMLSVCLDAGWRGPLFHFWYRETPEENTALVAALATRFGLDLHTVEVPGAFDVFDEVGHAFVHARTRAEREAARRMLAAYKQEAADAQRRLDYAGVFIGLRAEESRPRAITIARKGLIYITHDRPGATALPLARWTAADVWARHLMADLPWLARYDLAEDRDRERSETTYLAAEGIWRHGQGRRLRESDPALWARLTARWPGLAEWG